MLSAAELDGNGEKQEDQAPRSTAGHKEAKSYCGFNMLPLKSCCRFLASY